MFHKTLNDVSAAIRAGAATVWTKGRLFSSLFCTTKLCIEIGACYQYLARPKFITNQIECTVNPIEIIFCRSSLG